jgi:hypothetical protein
MPEKIIEVIDTNIVFDKNDNDDIVAQIVKDFDKWDDDRQAQLDLINNVAKLLDVTSNTVKSETQFGEKTQKARLRDADIVQLCDSAIAHTYNSNFKTPSQMIDVQLENQLNDSEMAKQALLQKAALLNVWKKSKPDDECRKFCENWHKKGEGIFYITWKQEYQDVRRKKENDILGFKIPTKKWEIQRQLKYDGIKIKCIDPENFVFDTTRRSEINNGCPVIYPTYKTFLDITENEEYKRFLDADAITELQNLTKKSSKDLNDIKNDEIDTYKAVKGDQLEVLEYWGDFKIKDKYYRNMRIVIAARKYVVAYGCNPNIISPFVYCAFKIHPDTGRGIPALAWLIPIVEATEEIINKINDILGLVINKPFLAPKGALSGKIEVKEGGVIEYDPALMPTSPVPLDFSTGIPISIKMLEWFEGKKEQILNQFKNSSGDTTTQPKTATEARIMNAGQDVVMSYQNSIIGQAIIEVFEKIGETMANFQEGAEQVVYKDKTGKEEIGTVDDTVRQSNYTYQIGDTASSIEKKINIETFLQQFNIAAQIGIQTGQGVPNIIEVINHLGSSNAIENPSKFWTSSQQPIGGEIGAQGEAGMPTDVQSVQDASMGGTPPALPQDNIQPY